MTIDLPKEVENFVINEASRENISHSELIARALMRLAEEQRIQNYKNDIELIKQGKMQMLSAEEVFGNVQKMIDEMKIFYSQRFLAELRHIVRFIAIDSKACAQEFNNAIKQSCQNLGSMPYKCRKSLKKIAKV